jgi:hypothetical protein
VRTFSKDLLYCAIHLITLVCGAMLENSESLFLAWYLPQSGSNGSETLVHCTFLVLASYISD